jgi:hypothetical protein
MNRFESDIYTNKPAWADTRLQPRVFTPMQKVDPLSIHQESGILDSSKYHAPTLSKVLSISENFLATVDSETAGIAKSLDALSPMQFRRANSRKDDLNRFTEF